MTISDGLTRLLPMPNVFRGEMTFRKSDAAILRFPFPLSSDGFTMTSVGAEPHDRSGPGPVYQSYFDIDEHYHDELADRAFILQNDRSRYQMLPHMEAAQWEATDFIMRAMAQDFPAHFTYRRDGEACFWENRLMNESRSFTFSQPETLPYEAFEYITRQVQGDFVLMDQRQGNLWLDGGMVTASYGWSFDFILGMDWCDWHGMLMGAAAESRVIDRALRMTMMLQADAPQRRVTWVHQVRARMDKSLENKIVWQHDFEGITRENLPDLLFVRSEFQQLYRLPHSNAVLFVLRNHLLSLRDVARVPKWAMRLHRALRDLSPDLARYSSIFMRQDCVDWLSQFDDGRPLSPGGGPDTDHLEPRR